VAEHALRDDVVAHEVGDAVGAVAGQRHHWVTLLKLAHCGNREREPGSSVPELLDISFRYVAADV
jgi:hypothetical protein